LCTTDSCVILWLNQNQVEYEKEGKENLGIWVVGDNYPLNREVKNAV